MPVRTKGAEHTLPEELRAALSRAIQGVSQKDVRNVAAKIGQPKLGLHELNLAAAGEWLFTRKAIQTAETGLRTLEV